MTSATAFVKARDIAREHSLEVLMLAIAYQAASSTSDMLNDYLRDPNYIKSEGIPTAASVREQALDFATVTMPCTLTESDYGTGARQEEGEKFFDFAMRIAVAKIYQAYPQLYDLRISALNVDKPTNLGDNAPIN
jgi:hypothetical protein